MREIEVRELPYLPLGHQGENEAQRIVWRGLADSWARLYGEGVFTLTVLREGDSAPYPASLKSENGDVIWTLSNADTAKAGEGMAELTYIVGGVIAKSRTWRTVVKLTLAVTAIAMAWLIDSCVLDFMRLNLARLLTGFTCGVELWSFLENAAQLSDAPLFRWLRRYVHRRIRKEAGDE